jgi:mannose-6-phosphate isomerase-like protein (cupin superfamily)
MDPVDAVRVIPYGGDALRILGECDGVAVGEIDVPPGFAGPPPHVHHGFDEALYVLSGTLTMVRGRDEPVSVFTGGLILAPRGVRHTFANPSDRPARVLGIWTPGAAMDFMAEIGAALPAGGPPDRKLLADIYRRHNSEIVP